MTEKLEVDCFEIDIETLVLANMYFDGIPRHTWTIRLAKDKVLNAVIANLTQESKKRFEEYQEKNNPCKEVE